MQKLAPLKLGVLGSGKGFHFRAIAESHRGGATQRRSVRCPSDVEDAGILDYARARGIRAEFIAPGQFRTKMEPEAEARLVGIFAGSGS